MSNASFGIGIFGGHALLFSEVAQYETLPEEAEMQGRNPEAKDNTIWVQQSLDLTVDPIQHWLPARHMPDHVAVHYESGNCTILRCSFEEFTAAYRQHLEEHTTRFPQRN